MRWTVNRWSSCNRRYSTYHLYPSENSGAVVVFSWIPKFRTLVADANYEDHNGEWHKVDKDQFMFMSVCKIKKYFETLARVEGHL